MTPQLKFLRRVRIHGRECGAVARALHHKVEIQSLPAVKENVSFTTNERKSMSTKTMFKRIALVTVSALSFGLLTTVSVTPANAVATGLVASVGPNGATSLTVVQADTGTAAALVRLDVTSNDTATPGLAVGETVTVSVTGVPATKTLAANGGSVADTSTAVGLAGVSQRSDFQVLESAAQTTGSVGLTAAAATSSPTDWTKLANGVLDGSANLDSGTVAIGAGFTARTADGAIGAGNTGFVNMDTVHELTPFNYTKSYYVTVRPRIGADVIDKGAYTFQFQLTDANGVVRSTKTATIEFVSTAAKSNATLTLASSGTFLANTAIATSDAASAAYITATLRDARGGLVRTGNGSAPSVSVALQEKTTAAPTFVDTPTASLFTVVDNGTLAQDFGTASATSPGNGTLQKADGVYGVRSTNPGIIPTDATTGRAYQVWAGYGSALATPLAITFFAVSGSGTASAARTDALLTATGMSASDQLLKSNSATSSWTVPAGTTSASARFYIQTSSDTATPGALITVTPTWSGPHGTAAVTPATSTTGTVYTTDANGVLDVSVTNSAPVAGAVLTLVLSGGAAFGQGSHTATITWATPVATTIAIADPITGVYVVTASTNVTTVIVKDQFGNPVASQSVTVSQAVTPAPAVASTTVIAPLATGADGTATYSNTGGAAITKDTLSFQCAPTACGTAASMVYNYVATLPVVATMAAYHGYTHGTAATTLTPSTGIYQSGTSTELVLRTNRNISKSLTAFTDSASDDMLNLRFYGLTSAGVAATGAVVTVTAGAGGHILDAAGLPVSTRNFLIGTTGYTPGIQVLATKTGAITFTATTGAVTSSAAMWVANATTDARFITITSAATGAANSTGVPATVSVTDRYGNGVSGVALNVTASGVGSFMGGGVSTSFTTDASGVYTFLANSLVAEGGVGTFSVSSGTTSDMSSVAGYVGATAVDSTLAAGNSTASASITFAAGRNSAEVAAEAAQDAAAEAIDAANAATDAANLAAEAADAATVAAEEARDAADAATASVEELATQVATLMAALKAQITTLANTVAKIAKKVKA